MGNVMETLEVMIISLDKKREALLEIFLYTKEQERLLKMEEFDMDGFNNIIKNKQVYIDQINEMDDGFEATFERIKPNIVHSPSLYQDDVNKMKELIKEIGELSISIQVQEERNQQKFNKIGERMRQEVKNYRKSKKTVTNYYNTVNNPTNKDINNLFDSSK